jgi:hypothetical protein
VDVDAVHRPAVGRGDFFDFLLAFGQRDVQHGLALLHAFEQELQGQRRLAGSRLAFDQVQPVADETAAQDLVQPSNTAGHEGSDWIAYSPMRVAR